MVSRVKSQRIGPSARSHTVSRMTLYPLSTSEKQDIWNGSAPTMTLRFSQNPEQGRRSPLATMTLRSLAPE